MSRCPTPSSTRSPRLLDGRAAARLTATAEVTMRDTSGGDGVAVYQVAAMVSEIDGKWVVTSAQVTPAGAPD